MSPYPAPSGQVMYSATSPFDIATIASQIERAASSLHAEDRGSVTVQADAQGFGGGLVVRGPYRTAALVTVTKPLAGKWGWSAAAQIRFLAGDGSAEQAPQKPSAFAPEFRGAYRLFRALGHGVVESVLRAVNVRLGVEVVIG